MIYIRDVAVRRTRWVGAQGLEKTEKACPVQGVALEGGRGLGRFEMGGGGGGGRGSPFPTSFAFAP